jgi:F0F1-type ATP synthase membrane subunit b/b'
MFWLWLVVIQLFVFTLLVVFLKMILTQNVSSATTHLHELNQDYNLKVEEANKKKAEVDRYYDEMLIKAKADAEKAKVELLRAAHATQEAVINEARQQGEDIIAQAAKAQEMALAEIDSKVEDRAMDRACEIAGAVLSEAMGEALHKLWVKELLKTSLGAIDKLHLPEDFEEAQVVSAFPLTDAERGEIEKKLKDGLQKEFRVTEKVQPEMIAGLQLRLGSMVIDGSLRAKVKEASRDVKRVQ